MANVEDWELRALTAEALLADEQQEIERLRAYIQELEQKLGEDMEDEPEPDLSQKIAEAWITAMDRFQAQPRHSRLDMRGAQLDIERREEDMSYRIRLKHDGPVLHYMIARDTMEAARQDPRLAREIVCLIADEFMHMIRPREGLSVGMLREGITEILKPHLQGHKGYGDYDDDGGQEERDWMRFMERALEPPTYKKQRTIPDEGYQKHDRSKKIPFRRK